MTGVVTQPAAERSFAARELTFWRIALYCIGAGCLLASAACVITSVSAGAAPRMYSDYLSARISTLTWLCLAAASLAGAVASFVAAAAIGFALAVFRPVTER